MTTITIKTRKHGDRRIPRSVSGLLCITLALLGTDDDEVRRWLPADAARALWRESA